MTYDPNKFKAPAHCHLCDTLHDEVNAQDDEITTLKARIKELEEENEREIDKNEDLANIISSLQSEGKDEG